MSREIDTEKVDLAWDLEDFFPGPYLPDMEYYLQRIGEATVEAAYSLRRGRVLDVACGTGSDIVFPLEQKGWQAWGLDASLSMLRLGQDIAHREGKVPNFVRGIAERLPFQDASFDRITCKGAMDHFASPDAFFEETYRILKPKGRLVITLANYESLSCKLGRRLWPLFMRLGWVSAKERPYWIIPPDHTFKGDLPTLLRMGRGRFRLLKCEGVSMLWLLPGWGHFLKQLPTPVAFGILKGLDRLARSLPSLGDVIVSTWVKREDQG